MTSSGTDQGEPKIGPSEPTEVAAVVRVLLVEDHAVIRETMASSLNAEPDMEVAGQAGSVAEARALLAGEGDPSRPVDVAVVDLGLPDGNGAELIREMRALYPSTQSLVLSASVGRDQAAAAVECGASGLLSKTSNLAEVVGAIRRSMSGETLMPLEEVVELLRHSGAKREEEFEARRAVASLTSREREVLESLAAGLGTEGIADELHIASRTVRNHVSSILAKLGVHSQLQALVFALRHGVVEIR